MWRSFNINKQNIKAETEKSVLIACPHNSDYDGYCFWHPAKLVRDGRNSNAVSISYTEDFDFYLKKYNKKHEVIDECRLGYDELEIVFEVMNENITSRVYNDYETFKPKQLEAKKVEVLAELRDD